MRIARVFTTRNSYTPTGEDCYWDLPDLFTPHYDEIHISVTFTWDIDKAVRWAKVWVSYGKILMGGPAVSKVIGEFTPGMYVKQGVTFTSRGISYRITTFWLVPINT